MVKEVYCQMSFNDLAQRSLYYLSLTQSYL